MENLMEGCFKSYTGKIASSLKKRFVYLFVYLSVFSDLLPLSEQFDSSVKIYPKDHMTSN